jgi:hypothetical protein
VAALDGRWFFSVDVSRRDAADDPADAKRDAALDARGRRADALADAILSGSLEDEPADSTAGCVPGPMPGVDSSALHARLAALGELLVVVDIRTAPMPLRHASDIAAQARARPCELANPNPKSETLPSLLPVETRGAAAVTGRPHSPWRRARAQAAEFRWPARVLAVAARCKKAHSAWRSATSALPPPDATKLQAWPAPSPRAASDARTARAWQAVRPSNDRARRAGGVRAGPARAGRGGGGGGGGGGGR